MGKKGNNPGKLIIIGITILLAGFASIIPVLVQAQKVIPDSTKFLIGSRVGITIELETEKGALVEWPVFGDTITRSIEILSKNPIDTTGVKGGNKLLLRQNLTITSFDTGFVVLPPIAFKVTAVGQGPVELKSEAVLLEVQGLKVDIAKDIKDIKPILTAPYTLRDFLPWLLLLVALGLLGSLIWFYIKNRKKNKPLISLPSKPQKPPHVIALEMLEELRREQVWQKGQVKEYYTRLTDILREYFEKRFGVNASEMTSEEILSVMKDYLSEYSSMGDLRKVLTLADLAKFAKGQPIGAENELSLTYARTIIMNSSEAPAISEANRKEEIKDIPGNQNH
ncbi:MAG: hypothetical protein IPH20_18760 [Bacteroidales bacterium]|nr:hypothetical protein [Bacteroidales bacterium]